ncbi:MAG: hypothetical protein AB8B57_17455 [Congregibacter sp.]
MDRLNKLLKGFGSACLVTLWCTSPVWGDDTEIFFGDLGTSEVRPNVLFIIDTSGSMNGNVNDIGDRLDNVQQAMYQLLDELDNVNVGLMRFTNPGGPVLFPVTYIDADVNAGDVVTVEASVTASEDDAQEVEGSGLMVIDARKLEFVEYTGAGLFLFEDQVNDDADDAEESVADGSADIDSGDFDVEIEKRFGVRFSGSSVPTGATITNAYMRFFGRDGGDSDPLGFRIYGQSDDSESFTQTGTYDLRDRADTTAFVDWAIPTVVGDQTVDTPSITAIVQEIVDNAVWDPSDSALEDDMVFIFEPQPGETSTAERKFSTRDDGLSVAPQLFIEYYVGTPPEVGLSSVGLRFDSVDIPRGVNVTDAYITFTAERDFASDFDLEVSIEESGDAASFASTAGDITSRPLASRTENWTENETFSSADTFQTPDLRRLIEEVTDRGDWCGGNALAFVIDGDEGQLPVWAFDGNPSLAPRLTVKYEHDSIEPGSSCIRRTLSRTIIASADDAEERGANVTTTGNSLDMNDGNVVGLRFANIEIPRNATIFEASIQMTARNDDGGTAGLSLQVEGSDNASEYTSTDGSVEARGYVAGSVTWTSATDWDDDSVYSSPDLQSLVSTITSRPGWEAGNAIAFRIDRTAGQRRAKSFNDSPAEAPRLVVSFEDDGSGLIGRTTRDVMKELVSQLPHRGYTPVQDTLYEAALYYTGGNVTWGAARGQTGVDGGPFNYTRVSAADSMVSGTYSINRPGGCKEDDLDDDDCEDETITGVAGGPTYDSPIDDSCQKQSHIIMLTDGAANRPHSATLIPQFMGTEASPVACLNEPTLNDDGTTSNLGSGERCVKDLAKYINETDMAPTLIGDQIITTHTIGFNFSSNWLEDVADAGGGSYKEASSASELVAEIKDIVRDVLSTDTTFVAPVAAVNEFNQLSHLNQVYFAVFRPEETPSWPGNIKRYALSEEGGNIIDADGNLAIDPDTGFFLSTARSFWSTDTDGGRVEDGGAVENLPTYTSRNVYTYVTGSPSTNLANSANAVVSTNTDLTPSLLDVSTMSTTEFADHIEWIRGKDVDDENENGNVDENRYFFGDPLHSRPVAVTYGGTSSSPDVEIFFGTNAGFIKSVDASNGQERFAFIPEALLPMQKDLRANAPTTPHLYGVDGTPTAWTSDVARDGISTSDAGDFVRLYTGMRRGGRNYYAMDATDRSNPQIMWQILGGSIQSNGDDFRQLGQSWSRPIKTRVILDGDTAPREVLFFSAGYDETQDDALVRTGDSAGRGMYIVDAVTGDLLWSGGKTGAQSWTESFSAMDYSFPSTLSVVDINQDGLADMWFVADTGGQLWRFDIANGETLANLVTGGVIADLGVAGGTNSIDSNRRFFSSPSVALIRGPDGPELAVAIGSGMRPSPLSILATNRMFLVRQKAVFSAPSSYVAVTESDLYDATPNTLATATGTALEAQQVLLNQAQGWFFDFGLSGEKALSSPLIANDRIIFTTYTPGDSGISCDPVAGTSRSYSVRLEDAVRAEPRPLLTPSIVDQATIIVPPPYVPDPNDADPNDPGDPNDPPGSVCPNGNEVVIKLNAEDGPIDDWCNDAQKTYWVREQ